MQRRRARREQQVATLLEIWTCEGFTIWSFLFPKEHEHHVCFLALDYASQALLGICAGLRTLSKNPWLTRVVSTRSRSGERPCVAQGKGGTPTTQGSSDLPKTCNERSLARETCPNSCFRLRPLSLVRQSVQSDKIIISVRRMVVDIGIRKGYFARTHPEGHGQPRHDREGAGR